jgi:hypothetical protein
MTCMEKPSSRRPHSGLRVKKKGVGMLDWPAILTQFPPWTGVAEPDSYRDVLGVRTRMTYLPASYMALAGTVQATLGAGLHDIPEWAGVLQAVLDAEDRFTCVELGAGWGPFVVGAAKAAERRGIEQITLVAVEAALSHLDFMRQHFIDNGLNPDRHRLIHGIVGPYDGKARFPLLKEPRVEWGLEAIYQARGCNEGGAPQPITEADEMLCLSLPTILCDLDFADLVHFDVQGSEVDVIEHGIDVLNAKVRRIVIGTHGRDLEARLLRFMDAQGWLLEMDKACSYHQVSPHPIMLLQDGVQVWRNLRPR